jgi:site-specific recombinase XerD
MVINDFQAFMASGGLVCPPEKKKIEYSVADEPGLFVECRASATGAPCWTLRLKNASGTNVYKRLGTVKDISLAQARKLVKQIRAEHVATLKADGAIALVTSPVEMTWDTFIKNHFAPYCKAHIRSAKKYDQLHRLYVSPRFGTLPLSQISRKDAQAMHVDMVEKQKLSPASADHAIKFMRRALNLAVQWDLLAHNPLKNFELFMVDNQVENYLSDAQMQSLLGVLRTDKNRNVCLILMLLLSTGARLNEILSSVWRNVSIEGRSLKVDAIRSKSKRSRSIPLNDSALWVLEQLDSRDKSAYLFPSPVFAKDGKDLPYTNITRAWYRIQKLAGIKIRAHDLRHGFASMLVSGGRSLYEVQQILGHSDPKVTMRYAHLSSKTLQEAANAGSVIVPRVEAKAA